MSNYYDSRLNDNDQQRSNQQGASRVVEIPVIHCTPSENKQQQQQQQQQPHHHHHHHHQPPPPQTQSYSPSSSRFYQQQPQHSPSQRTAYFDQPLITDDFNAPFDHFDSGFPRRFFQDPLSQGSPIDEFFSRSPFDTGRRSPHTINTYPQHRFASDYHKSPLGSPKNSPKLSPRFEKSQTPTRTTSTNTEQQQQENPPSPTQQHHHHHHHHPHHQQQQQQPSTSFTIPVNYVKTDHQNREKSPYTPADIPFSSYSSSPKRETPSVAEQLENYRREQQQQQQDRQRSPGPQQQQQQKQTADTHRSPSPKETSGNMGGSNQKQTNNTHLPSDFIKLATDAANMNTPPRSTTPVRVVKSSQEKIDDVNVRLASLDKEVDDYVGVEGKKDRRFLLLEENLTQCLLKLDEIDRDNDDINKQRRALIKATQAIIDKLESKIRGKKDSDEQQQQQQDNDENEASKSNNSDKSNENNSDNNNQSNNNNNNSDNKTETN